MWQEPKFEVFLNIYAEVVDGFVDFQINEFVDARDLNMGAWFEAQIVNVTKGTPSSTEADGTDEDIRYHVTYEE